MTKLNLENIETRESGIHNEFFYTKHKLDLINNDEYENIQYDLEPLINDYLQHENITKVIDNETDEITFIMEDGAEIEEEEIREEIERTYTDAICLLPTTFEPRIFDTDIARQCDLLPFTYSLEYEDDINLLALGGCGMDLSPRLDAYQALITGYIDPSSTLFSQFSYFESLMGKELTQQVIAAITKN